MSYAETLLRVTNGLSELPAGKNEPDTLEEIFRLMGKPTEENMPGCTKLQ